MSSQAHSISPLRQRMIEDMTLRKLSPKAQSGYIRWVKRLAKFLGRSPDTATAENLRRFHGVIRVLLPEKDIADGRLQHAWMALQQTRGLC